MTFGLCFAINAREPTTRLARLAERRQAAGLPGAGHRAAELGDPAAGDADVSGFPVTGRDHGRAADDEFEAHSSSVAGSCQAGVVPRPGQGRVGLVPGRRRTASQGVSGGGGWLRRPCLAGLAGRVHRTGVVAAGTGRGRVLGVGLLVSAEPG
jgi:hypothetical protein